MRPELSAVLVSAATTAGVASVGAAGLLRLAVSRPAAAARLAPAVLVLALAGGVAVATRGMVIAEDDYRTVLFVLAAGAPTAALIGVLMARGVSQMQLRVVRERAERLRAEQLEAARREMLGWLSHDLRTPLAGVRLLAETLADPPDRAPDPAASRIVREVDRLDAMVDDIVELSRMHGLPAGDSLGGPSPGSSRRREAVRLDDLVSDCVECLAPLAGAAGVSVAPGQLCGAEAVVDVASVSRAVTNLLRNAVRYSVRGAGIRVSTVAQAGRVDVVVDDECGGIPPDDLGRVFDPGWRGDGSRGSDSLPGADGHTRSAGGMGLGLAIVAEVARIHGGTVAVRNRPDGRGCTFTLSLPGNATGAGSPLTRS